MTQVQNDVFKAVDLLEMAKRAMPCVEIESKCAEALKTIFKGQPVVERIKNMDTGQFSETKRLGYNEAMLAQLDSRLDVLTGDKKKSRTAA